MRLYSCERRLAVCVAVTNLELFLNFSVMYWMLVCVAVS